MLSKIRSGSSLHYLLLDYITPYMYSPARPRVYQAQQWLAYPSIPGSSGLLTPLLQFWHPMLGLALWVAGAYEADEPFSLNIIQHQATLLTTSERWWLPPFPVRRPCLGESESEDLKCPFIPTPSDWRPAGRVCGLWTFYVCELWTFYVYKYHGHSIILDFLI